jgi:glyoxylase-like metal-dependent hydrolase (beta-lactamase superfamily II)
MVHKVIPNVYRIPGFVNVYVIDNSDNSLALIDTGLPMIAKNILKGLRELGYPGKPIKTILITHADGDHFGLAARFTEETGIIPQTSAVEADSISRGVSSRPLRPAGVQRLLFSLIAPLIKPTPSKADGSLIPGDTIDLLGGLQVVDSKGHTPGHLSFYSPQDRILFCGDSITLHKDQLAPSSTGNTWDMSLAKISFERQMALGAKYICGGHCFVELPDN